MKIWFPVFVLFVPSAVLSVEIDYYWRDYDGKVPSDAFEAGIDTTGKLIYIGQAFFDNVGLLPGTLRPGFTSFKVTAKTQVFRTNQFVKILCTGHPENFRWVQVNSYSDISRLTDVHLVQGGIETNTVVHIGRARHEGDLEIGKIYNVGDFKGVALPNYSETGTDYMNFDILTYNYNMPEVKCNFRKE